MPTLNVDLGERSYPIYIETGLFNQAGFLLSAIQGKQCAIVTNETVAPLFLNNIKKPLNNAGISSFDIILPDGEQYKTVEYFNVVLTQLLENRAARDTTLIALGGGVIGDMGGFAAACYQRGIPFIQVPTTLLSQVDSSVGGKTAVNHPLGKNMIGAFYQPKAVFIDTNSLSTLPEREFSAGMAEVIKYGIMYDGDFFTWIENQTTAIKNRDPDALRYLITKCCAIKAEVVNLDEKEHGVRALLNLGHTFGHAIEAEKGYGVWLHGEAVAAGMALATKLAVLRNWISMSESSRIQRLLTLFNLPISGPADMSADIYIAHMQHDKKVLSGKMRFIVPTSIGRAKIIDDVKNEELTAILN
ncbi:MAG: 3-dehydroquinate synthase [Bermanella sp.]|jgi:3-dehydroquinate synthase|uniref:3-dehydroquinate synthase n=1 Tax=Glaciecola sp. 33A TaxID=2057807 RepID=UPI000C345728|nr:3-dehydroquinate synthase [Glaciecola sp. 33A]PKI00590.1 3-dehydroquinate synthase [Glaciecola sp. 33A]